jgi:predicted transcriptional regulator
VGVNLRHAKEGAMDVLDLLNYMKESKIQGWTIRHLAKRLGRHESGIARCLKELFERGLVTRTKASIINYPEEDSVSHDYKLLSHWIYNIATPPEQVQEAIKALPEETPQPDPGNTLPAVTRKEYINRRTSGIVDFVKRNKDRILVSPQEVQNEIREKWYRLQSRRYPLDPPEEKQPKIFTGPPPSPPAQKKNGLLEAMKPYSTKYVLEATVAYTLNKGEYGLSRKLIEAMEMLDPEPQESDGPFIPG